jgi:aminoglycoside phosphotransferase (APT) family kinase protein
VHRVDVVLSSHEGSSPGPSAPTPPPADRKVGPDEVRRLCQDIIWLTDTGKAPGRPTSIRRVGEGWDTTSWRIARRAGDRPRDLVLRVPRRASATDLLGHELRVLRLLDADPTPLPIPTVWGRGGPEDRPAALVLEWHDGIPAATLDDQGLAGVGRQLAPLLARVHRVLEVDLPRSPVRGVPLGTRDASFAADLAAAHLNAPFRQRMDEIWQQGLAAPDWDGPALLLHGDPHPGNVVVTADGLLQALIDWGDTTPGDPASDLGGLILLDPANADGPAGADRCGGMGGRALAHYRAAATWPGVQDDAVWSALVDRARAWAVRYSLALGNAYPASHGLGAVAHRMWARLG